MNAMVPLAVMQPEVRAGAIVGDDLVLFEIGVEGLTISVEKDGEQSTVFIPARESAAYVLAQAIEVLRRG